ncbi:L-2,4-diaminobutyric acid acetyltransferase [wastewater metagenome]|uniref:L-2,4-diaminobutyric acid acetyltransferase n=2 Tax=unclassified sequences TaxID=12908 RepID=A0A5B8R982_9ZZZZ|nr:MULTISPECIES: diaminobutyrate acetyltransferase [Arhodomonas]MCS4503162.1 diaminobutyrate acetyltransferase [Arhodomonas aquaeolei]QEA04518.1 L-2,4-diaminobutyric acid acetyltransferase [uncultured organism]
MASRPSEDGIILRQPAIADGGGMWRVVRDAGVLDENSSYLYLLMARDFSETCVVAERDGRTIGFVTGYRRPQRPDTAFLWQVGLLPEAQGLGLGKRLVAAFLRAPGCQGATRLETTITPDNAASRALFRAVARDLGAECAVSPCFTAADFPEAGHDDEELFSIGPFTADAPNTLNY